MTAMMGKPIGAPELVEQLQDVIVKIMHDIGETEEILQAFHLLSALKLCVGHE